MSPVVLRVIKPRIFTSPALLQAIRDVTDSEEDITIEDIPPATQDMTDSEDIIQDTHLATQYVTDLEDVIQDTPLATQDVTDSEDGM